MILILQIAIGIALAPLIAKLYLWLWRSWCTFGAWRWRNLRVFPAWLFTRRPMINLGSHQVWISPAFIVLVLYGVISALLE
jgi:hypothetical protein